MEDRVVAVGGSSISGWSSAGRGDDARSGDTRAAEEHEHDVREGVARRVSEQAEGLVVRGDVVEVVAGEEDVPAALVGEEVANFAA